MVTAILLAVTTVAFVFVCGANDGGALLSMALRHRVTSAAGALTLLAAGLVVGPALFGLSVARTFTERLVPAGQSHAHLVFLGGTLVTLAVVLALTWRGIPTSVTLAVLGSLAGTGVTLGVAPSWPVLARVLVIGAAAPFVGGAVGYLLALAVQRLPAGSGVARTVRLAHLAAYAVQCLAYAANDGQKMYAVVGIALAAAHVGAVAADPAQAVGLWLAVALVFAVGAVASLRRVVRGTTADLVVPRPWQVVSAELATSATVLGAAGLGVPVSMTQAMTGGLVGAGASQGLRRVRWQYAVPTMVAWLVTLPAGFVGGLLAGLVLREVAG